MSTDLVKQAKQVSRQQWLRRLAQRRQNKVAFVLSGGGPYGAIQVGALRALLERGIRPDMVVGTSAGAMNATFLALNPTEGGVARLATLWQGIESEDLFPGARFKTSWARFVIRGNRVFDNSGLRRVIETRLGQASFEDMKVPLTIITTELETGAERHFTSGPIIETLLASAAMPGIYPPVEIDGRLHIDGGVVNAVPLEPAVTAGAKKIYVLNCSASQLQRRPLTRPMDYLLHAFMLSRSQRFERDLPLFSQKAEVVVIPAPRLNFSAGFTSMEHTGKLIAAGYETTARFLDSLAPPATKKLPQMPAAEIAAVEAIVPAT